MLWNRKGEVALTVGLVLAGLAACTAAPPPETTAAATVAPTAALTVTPPAKPWVLVDAAVPDAVLEAATGWASGERQGVEARDLGAVSGEPPAGLWAVLGLEENLSTLTEGWRRGTAFLVLDPSSLAAGERTSTLGPGVAYDEAGFLAGIVAGLATRSELIGVVPGAGEAGGWRTGFEQGVRYSCPKCQLEDVSDPGRPSFAMDVIGIPPQAEITPTAPAAAAPWLVVFEEAPAGWSEWVAARVRTAPEALVGPALTRLAAGTAGEAWVFATADGGLAIEIERRAISPGRERLLREAEARLAAGILVVGGD